MSSTRNILEALEVAPTDPEITEICTSDAERNAVIFALQDRLRVAQQAIDLLQTQAEAQTEAAALRQAIERYLSDVTLGPEVLKAAVRDTQAGLKLAADVELLKHQLAVAQAHETHCRTRLDEAWTFIGRIDYALQYEIAGAKDLKSARKWGAKMHAEVNAKVGKP